MRIDQFESHVLDVPAVVAGNTSGPAVPGRLQVIIVLIKLDSGQCGLGLTTSVRGGRAIQAILETDARPFIVGENAMDHERLAVSLRRQLRCLGRGGAAGMARSAIDIALWDLKGKATGLPLFRLLGGARESAPVYASERWTADRTVEQTVESAQQYLDQGMMGLKIQVGSQSAEADAERLSQVREALGDDVWLGVDACESYDYATALSMGHFFEEEMGIDWFEDPIPIDDVEGYRRLVQHLEVPIAVGGDFCDLHEFRPFLAPGGADVLLPNVARVGGITAWQKIAALAAFHHLPIAPCGSPEISVHLACGMPNTGAVEYSDVLDSVVTGRPEIARGQIVAPERPGHGLELAPDALTRWKESR